MTRHHSCLSLVLILAVYASAYLQYVDPTTSCSASQALGTSIYCCSGSCYDGTGIQSPGLCLNVFDGCYDSSEFPSCPASQVLKGGPVAALFIDRGIGNCWGGDECQWGSNQWEWTCCDCPSGTVPETPGVCPEPTYGSRYCVGCTEDDEVLSLDGGKYTCATTTSSSSGTPPDTNTDIDGTSNANSTHKGLSCNIVDHLAKQFECTSAVAPDTNGYYRQVMNLACLRSDCPNPACDYVRKYAKKDPRCALDGADFSFEQTVFQKFAGNIIDPSTCDEVAETAGKIELVASMLAAVLRGVADRMILTGHPLAMIGGLAAENVGATDPRTIGSVFAGGIHFALELYPDFQDYIQSKVLSGTMDAAALAAEHDNLFECAVGPGFQAEAAQGDLSPEEARLASKLVPWLAGNLRNQIVSNTMLSDTSLEPSLRIKRSDSPTLDTIANDLGVSLPTNAELRTNVRNWEDLTVDTLAKQKRAVKGRELTAEAVLLPGGTMSMTELRQQSPSYIGLGLLTPMIVDIPERDQDLNPIIAQVAIFYPDVIPPTSITSVSINDQAIRLVGPIASICDPAVGLVMWNATHCLGKNYNDPLRLIADVLAESQTYEVPVVPDPTDDDLLYRNAALTLMYDPSYLDNYDSKVDPNTDIAVFDLINGTPLSGSVFTSTGPGGFYEIPLAFGNGIWGGNWRGGGMFGLGLLKSPSNATTSSNLSISTSSLSASSSSLSATTSSLTNSSTVISPTSSLTTTTLSLSTSNSSSSATSLSLTASSSPLSPSSSSSSASNLSFSTPTSTPSSRLSTSTSAPLSPSSSLSTSSSSFSTSSSSFSTSSSSLSTSSSSLLTSSWSLSSSSLSLSTSSSSLSTSSSALPTSISSLSASTSSLAASALVPGSTSTSALVTVSPLTTVQSENTATSTLNSLLESMRPSTSSSFSAGAPSSCTTLPLSLAALWASRTSSTSLSSSVMSSSSVVPSLPTTTSLTTPDTTTYPSSISWVSSASPAQSTNPDTNFSTQRPNAPGWERWEVSSGTATVASYPPARSAPPKADTTWTSSPGNSPSSSVKIGDGDDASSFTSWDQSSSSLPKGTATMPSQISPNVVNTGTTSGLHSTPTTAVHTAGTRPITSSSTFTGSGNAQAALRNTDTRFLASTLMLIVMTLYS